MGIELSPQIDDHGFQKKRDSSCLAFLDAFCRVPPLYSLAQITTAKWMRSTFRQGGMAMKFVFFLRQWEGMSGKRTMVGQYCYQGYPGKGQQNRYTTLTNIPPRVKRVSTLSYFLLIVHTMIMENRPVDPGSIQSGGVTDLYPCHIVSFMRIKHGTCADDILSKTEY